MRPSNLNSQPLISQKVKPRNVLCKMCLSHHDMINFLLLLQFHYYVGSAWQLFQHCWGRARAFHMVSAASYPDVSLSMKMCAQRKAGRRQRASPELRLPSCRLYPSHGTLRFITRRFSTLRKTKRLRRRLWSPWSLQSLKGCILPTMHSRS